uniref:Neuronal PAS domain protein 3 n=1 Tax=Cyprinus carpio TaxID=7962 RepID=A0A8C2KXR1_CYPCA
MYSSLSTFSLHLQYHDLGALEQGTEPPTAPRAPQLQALRKEKSRDAARSRRGKENFEFYELAKMLPLPGAITSQLDKASIIRLTISYLKMRDFANQGDPPWNLRIEGPPPNTSVKGKSEACVRMPTRVYSCCVLLSAAIGSQRRRSPSAVATEIFEPHLGSHILQSLDGFVFALNKEGRFLYISETVSIYLGLSQVSACEIFTLRSLFVHRAGHETALERETQRHRNQRGRGSCRRGRGEGGGVSASRAALESNSPSLLSPDNILERSFFIRMKSTLTKRGVHIKSSGYKVIHITGRLRIRMALTHSRSVPNQIMGMVVMAHALPPPTINEVRIDCQMFVTRVNMDLNIVYCENRISDYMDLTPVDIVGKRCYHFIHAEDVEGIRQSHLDLMNKGQCVTKYYRWIQKNGGYIWIQSSATIAINAKNGNEKNIIWVNYVLSNPEYKDTPMDIAQLPNLPGKASESSETSDSESDSKENSEDNENSKSDGKGNQSSENSEDPESDSKKQMGQPPEQEMRRQEEGDSSSNPESQDSDDSLEPSDCETDNKEGRLGGLHIKVEHYGDGEVEELQDSPSSFSSSEEEEDEVEDIVKDCNSGGELSGPAMSKHQKRKKRRKKQKWDGSRQRLCLSPSAAATPSPGSLDPTLGDQPPLLLPPSPTSSSVLKIKTEMSEPINFDNDSSIWNYPPNREISCNESPYSMTKPHNTFPSPPPAGLQVSIPDSVLTPPGAEGGGGSRNAPTSVSSATLGSLVPPSSSTTADPLSPPLSASPRDKQQGTPTSSGSLLYTSDLEALYCSGTPDKWRLQSFSTEKSNL